jgi:hypothetical protein
MRPSGSSKPWSQRKRLPSNPSPAPTAQWHPPHHPERAVRPTLDHCDRRQLKPQRLPRRLQFIEQAARDRSSPRHLAGLRRPPALRELHRQQPSRPVKGWTTWPWATFTPTRSLITTPALVVRISAPGAQSHVVPERVGRMRPVVLPSIVLSPGAGLAGLQQQVQAIENPGDVLLAGSVGAISVRCGAEELRLLLEK